MEKYHLKENINVFRVKAYAFPQGIQKAFDTLSERILETRTLFGISSGNRSGGIDYYAAMQELTHGEGVALGFEPFTIKQGEYRQIIIQDWHNNMSLMGEAFDELLQDPQLDTSSPCVEWYLQDGSVRCMIRVVD